MNKDSTYNFRGIKKRIKVYASFVLLLFLILIICPIILWGYKTVNFKLYYQDKIRAIIIETIKEECVKDKYKHITKIR